jgi:DNA-binding winged helix-turn-helix (wHTH) protein/tetratricopeptide (TPR) repeat protein
MGHSTAIRLRFDAFDLDEADARLKRDGKPVALPPKAFGVLCALARQPGVLVTKNALLDAVWGHQHVSESVLKTTISQVRAALADDASSPRYIETASRLGYRFIGAAQAGPAPAAPREAPPPTVAAPIIPDSFVGRREALAKLQECWQRSRAGQRQLLWVAGDAGVGKSTLLETFVRGSGAAMIAQGQCVEQYGTGEPYLPVLQALGDLCREYTDLAAVMRSVAPTWMLQLPWLSTDAERAALARELVGVSQERMVREFHELIARFTEKQPLLFVIEDLHWSDEATLRLMDHYARHRGPARVLWIGSFRLTQVIAEGHPLQGLRQELRMHRLAQEIVLDPFSESEVLAYLRQRAPVAEAPEDFVRRVHSHTDGLPLFVVNVVDALLGADNDAGTSARNRATFAANTPLPVPEDLMGAVETRIGKLPAATVSLLEAAAVCGVEFRAGAVAEICGRSLPDLIEEFDRLVQKQFWLRHSATLDLNDGSLDSVYTFRHAIYRHVFYHRIGVAPRLQLHRRVAAVLAAGAAKGVPVAPAELASHHERGREPAAALRFYAQAAQLALRSFAPLQAHEICEHALTLLPLVPAGPEQLMLELGIQSARGVAAAQIRGVGSSESRAVFERVRELCELLPRHPARALLLNGYGASLFSRAEYARLQEFAEQLEKLEGPDRQPLMVMTALFRAGAASARGECKLATECWLQAIQYCEAITDRSGFQTFIVDPETGIRANAVRTLFERGLFDQAREQSAKAVAMAEALGQPLAQSLARWRAGMLEVRLGNPDKVIEHALAVERIVLKTCVAQGDGPSRYLRGWALAQQGDPIAGLALIRDGLERHLRIGMISSCTEVMGYAAEALVIAGDWDAANQELAQAFARAREIDEHFYVPMLLMIQSRVAKGQGDAAAAYQWLREARRTAREQHASGFELKAAIALVEHPQSSGEDRQALATLLATLVEGHDTRDYRRGVQLTSAR